MVSTLSPGDLAIIGVNSDDSDSFKVVLLTDIEAGTEIFFTDKGVKADGSLRSNEGIIKYTAPSALPIGSVIEYTAGVSGDFSSDSGSFSLSNNGDQVIAYQGTSASPSFIYAVHTNSTEFQADATSANNSALPTGLVVGTSAVAVGSGAGDGNEIDNSAYNGTVTTGTSAELLAAIGDAANWNGSNDRIDPLANFSFTVMNNISLVELTGTDNPFENVNGISNSAPSLGDIDGDGDLDAFIGEISGTIKYYENTGSTSSPVFVEKTGTDNPFNSEDVGDNSSPSLVDIDGDGDLDAFIGEKNGTIKYYENIGSSSNPDFVENTNNPLSSVNLGFLSNPNPSFADIDGDDDFDAFIGSSDGTISYYENTGSTNSPSFFETTGTDNPFNGESVVGSSPTFADLDQDTDLDVLIGATDGTISYYENTGSTNSPVFIKITGTDNPLDGEEINSSTHPELADLDGDGDPDLVVGNNTADDIRYFINDNAAPEFINPLIDNTGTDSPFNGVNVASKSSPSFADLDDDGDPDLILGQGDGSVSYFENTGTSTNPIYIEETGASNPFDGIDVGDTSTPSLADLDGDGTLDAVIGAADGSLNYYQNTGDVNNPAFSLVTGTDSPVDGISATSDSSPTFVDLDDDGDLDLVLGNDTFYLKYYENTGNSTNPAFVEQTGTDNPFDNQPVGEKSNAGFADIDNDGDLDALVGRGGHGEMSYLENTGSSSNPAFVLMLDDGNPLNDIDLGTATSPSFVDVDGDDDLEAVVGENSGTLYYFLNQTPKYSLTTIDEDETNPAGDTVGDIIPDGSVVDRNGAVEAIAVTDVDDANGTWQYQANGSTTWTNFGSVSDSTALLLDSTDMMRFVPDAGYKGESNFTFRLWDKTSDTAGAIADASSNGSITAFSEDTATGEITVNPLPITVTGSTEYTGTSLNDSLNGSSGDDTVIGGLGNDSINGNDGADRLHGDIGDDVLNGNANNDFINGGEDDDSISGGSGDDFLMGDEGADTLSGDAGMDTLFGGAGNDILNGGADSDRLSGFGGSDVFVLTKGDVNNIIYDYTDNIDKFGLELSSFTNSSVSDVFTNELSIAQNGTSTTISSGGDVLATVYNTTATSVMVDDFTDF